MVSHACVCNDEPQVGLAELKGLTQVGNLSTFTSLKALINTDTNLHIHFLMLAAQTHTPTTMAF